MDEHANAPNWADTTERDFAEETAAVADELDYLDPLTDPEQVAQLTEAERFRADGYTADDIEKDQLLLEVLSCPSFTPPGAQPGRAVAPPQTVSVRENCHTLFASRDRKRMAVRYAGVRDKDCAKVRNIQREVEIKRWRAGGPALQFGFESVTEKNQKLIEKSEANAEVPLAQRTVHPDDVPPPPPPPPPPQFVFSNQLLMKAADLAKCMVIAETAHYPQFGDADAMPAPPPDWPVLDNNQVMRPGYDRPPNKFELAYAIQLILELQSKVERLYKENDKLKTSVAGLEAAERLRVSVARHNAAYAAAAQPVAAQPAAVRHPNAIVNALAPGLAAVRRAVAVRHIVPANYLTVGRTNMPIMERRADQDEWPDELWYYLLGGCAGVAPPKVMKERNRGYNCFPLDVPRQKRGMARAELNPVNINYETTYYFDDLLAEDDFDPDYRGLNLILVRDALIESAEREDAVYPPPGLRKVDGGQLRYNDRLNGRDDGNDCAMCCGCHFMKFCPVVSTYRHRLRLMKARNNCLVCRGYHPGERCHQLGGKFQCHMPACQNADPHHREMCPRSRFDEERVRLQGDR